MTFPLLDVILMNVKSCCYGLTSLRIGSIIIFGLTLFFSILQLFGWFVPSITFDKKIDPQDLAKDVPPILDYYAIQYAMLGIIVSICGLIGLCGVSNRKSSSLLPYIIITVVETASLWIATAFNIGLLLSQKRSFYNAVPTAEFPVQKENLDDIDSAFASLIVKILIGGLVFSVINWYCTGIVYSYNGKLESEEQSNQGSAPRQNMLLNSIP